MSALTIAVFSARSAETARSAASVFMEKSSETSAYEDGSNASCRIRLVLSVVASDWVGGQHRRGGRVEERRLTASRFSAWQQERLEGQTEKQTHRTVGRLGFGYEDRTVQRIQQDRARSIAATSDVVEEVKRCLNETVACCCPFSHRCPPTRR